MAFFNCFMNFNLNFRPTSFNFSLGYFSMPNLFSCAPRFNMLSSPISFFQRYNQPFTNNFPRLYSRQSSFTYINTPSSPFGINYNNFNYIEPLNCFDTFEQTIKHSNKTKKDETINSEKETIEDNIKKEYEYSSLKDKYAANNNKFIVNLTSEMQTKTKKLIAYANEAGYEVKITSGKRSKVEQEALVARDKKNGTKLAASKNSPHLQGIAIDIEVYKDGKKLKNEFPDLTNYAKKELGFRWGGDFVNWTKEPWHFDLKKV